MTRTLLRRISIASTLLVIVAAIGCGEHDLTGASFLSLSISPDTTRLVSIGEAPKIALSAQDLGGNSVEPKLVYWVSSDPSVVEVAQDGTVVGVRDGSAIISAFVSSTATARTTVTVNASVEMEVAIIGVSTRPIARIADTVPVTAYDKNAPERLRKP